VSEDVQRLIAAPQISPRITVSGHVYDVATGRVETVVKPEHPDAQSLSRNA
jgi:carbonic anhydrase